MFLKENILYIVKRDNLSKSKLSILTSLPYMTISDIMSGKISDPRISSVSKIALGLKISIDDLIFKDLSKEIK